MCRTQPHNAEGAALASGVFSAKHRTQNTEHRTSGCGQENGNAARTTRCTRCFLVFLRGSVHSCAGEHPSDRTQNDPRDLVPPVHPPYSHQGLLEHGTSWRSKLRPLFRTVPAGHLSQHEPLCRDLRTPNANEWSLLRLNCVPFTPARPMIKIEHITVLKTSFDLFSVGLGDLT